MNKNSQRWLITTLKVVYVVENFRLSLDWEDAPSCRKKSRWNQHWNQRVSLFTSAIPRTTQPMIQNHLRRHLPSSTSTTLYSTLLYEPNSSHPTLLKPNSTQVLQPIIRYSVPSLRQGRRPHRSVGSPPRISPSEGWRMKPGHNTPWNRGSPEKK